MAFSTERIPAPSEGRRSMTFMDLEPVQESTNLYFVDNKAIDISNFNSGRTKGDMYTTVVQTVDLPLSMSQNQNIQLDDRTLWGAEGFGTIKSVEPNVSSFGASGQFTVIRNGEEHEVKLNDGNYCLGDLIDQMNMALIDLAKKLNLTFAELGVKIDTRQFSFGSHSETWIIEDVDYYNKAIHPDILLLPGCAVSFGFSKLPYMLGILPKSPFIDSFVISYDDISKGNLPRLIPKDGTDQYPTLVPNDTNQKGYIWRSVVTDFNRMGPGFDKYIITVPDASGNSPALFLSFPDLFTPPITFKDKTDSLSNLPVHCVARHPELLSYFNVLGSAVNAHYPFGPLNPFPSHAVLKRPPWNDIQTYQTPFVSEYKISKTPVRNRISSVQRYVVMNAQRKANPYVTKHNTTFVLSPLGTKAL